jgi:hypothetical protein
MNFTFNSWVEAYVGGLKVPEGLYSPEAKYMYFGTCLKIHVYVYEFKSQEKLFF